MPPGQLSSPFGNKEETMSYYPRVFIEGKEQQPKLGVPISVSGDAADVLVVCGQGVYANGTYYGEFHDRDVYFEHALRYPEIVKKFNYNVVVISGGFTQKDAPCLSEAESFRRILADAGSPEPSVPIILDEAALDSAENLLLGLMTARLVLGSTPIRRVGIWAAWKFKKWRFNRNAEALGIVERTYFHGFSSAAETNVQVPPDDARQRSLSEYREDSVEFKLLRAPDKEAKRRERWQNNAIDKDRDRSMNNSLSKYNDPDRWSRSVRGDKMLYDGRVCSNYGNRLSNFRSAFPATWEAIDMIADGTEPRSAGLRKAFVEEVMRMP
jgi:hypothetical protein